MIPIIKKILGVCFVHLIFLSTSGYAQFLNKNAMWTVINSTSGDGIQKDTLQIKIEKDSIINDTLYSIINFWDEPFALRENGNKVYFRLLETSHYFGFDNYSEYLAYDFGLNVNDSIRLNLLRNTDITDYWKVKAVDSVLVGGENKKRIMLQRSDEADPFGVHYWVEDVGSSEGPLYFTRISEFEFATQLSCYWVNGDLMYHNEFSNAQCEFLDVILYQQVDKEILLFDNSLNKVKVNLPLQKECILSVYTMEGSVVNNRKIECNTWVDINRLKPGIYILSVNSGSSQTSIKIWFK